MLESLIKVGALTSFGHPAQLLLGLDDAIAAGAGHPARPDHAARPRCSTSARPTPRSSSGRCRAATEVPVRERLRWEKELLGLYLSEHPMGEVAEQVGQYVTAYSGDLKRRVARRAARRRRRHRHRRPDGRHEAPATTMAIATLEDLQGTIEVVVFPRLYETTRPTWRDGAILLVAGRVDHKGEEVSLLADLVVDWDEAAAPRAGGVRSRGRRRRSRAPRRQRRRPAHRSRSGTGAPRPMVGARPRVGRLGPRRPVEPAPAVRRRPIPYVSPLRTRTSEAGRERQVDLALPPIAPGRAGLDLPRGRRGAGDVGRRPRRRAGGAGRGPRTRSWPRRPRDDPVEAGPETVLHVRFAGAAAPTGWSGRWRRSRRSSATGRARRAS